MKKFFKKLLIVLGWLMLVLIVAAIIGIVYVSKTFNSTSGLCKSCILELSFQDNISEKASSSNLLSKALDEPEKLSLRETLDLLHNACSDDRIEAISIDGNSYLQHTQAIEIAEALEGFKASCDKPIYSYGDFYTQSSYLLATHADSMYLHPMGSVNLVGYRVILSYFSDFLNRWDINLEIYKAGKYKSYVEAYTQESPSQENIEQYNEILYGLESELVRKLEQWKGKDTTYWKDVIKNNIGARAQNAIEEDLVDKLIYESEYKNQLTENFSLGDNGFISLTDYKKTIKKSKKKANIAYVVMEGIIDTEGEEISSSVLKNELRAIRNSDQYKAVILRVNSGGGSSFASDDIWKEVSLIREKGIPVIASIGNVAASGGYYVLMNSDKIFAQENSIVGSIGVFIMVPQFNEALKTHLGIDFAEIKTSPYNSSINTLVDLSPEMKLKLQKETDFIYDTFISKVSSDRNIEKSKVKEIAQGRVYTGSRAKEIGLIDDIKQLSEVKSYVKSTYDLDYIGIDEYPRSKKGFLPWNLGNVQAHFNNEINNFPYSEIIKADKLLRSSLLLEPRMEMFGFSIE